MYNSEKSLKGASDLMLIQINDHIQLDSSIGLDFKPDETYGDKVIIDDQDFF